MHMSFCHSCVVTLDQNDTILTNIHIAHFDYHIILLFTTLLNNNVGQGAALSRYTILGFETSGRRNTNTITTESIMLGTCNKSNISSHLLGKG